MDIDFGDLDAGLAQLSKEFEGIQTGIRNLSNDEDPFSEFLNETPPSNSYAHRTNHQKFDPMSIVLEGLDNMTPRGNALDKALEEIDVLIDASNSRSPMSPGSKNSRGRGMANTRNQTSSNDLRKKASKPYLERQVSTMKLEKQTATGPSYFTLPEVIDTAGCSAADLQRFVRGLQEEMTSMAKQANSELQKYYNQVKSFDEDNAKAFKTIQDLKADLQAQSEDWENSERKWKAKVDQLEAEKSRMHKLSTSSTGNSAEVERYKSGLRSLNQIKIDLEKRVRLLASEAGKKDHEIENLRSQNAYLYKEKKALEETAAELVTAGLSNTQREDYERLIKDQEQDIGALQREVTALKTERKILQSQVEQMSQEMLAKAGSSEDVPELKLQILKLEAESENSNLKIRRLVAAIKADRVQSEEKIKEIKGERDEQEKRAENLEEKIVQLMEKFKVDREKQKDDAVLKAALDEAREALKETENQIRFANESASNAERALQQKEQELQKVLLFGKKKAREAQMAVDDIKSLEEKYNKLVEAVKGLKEENQRLKAGSETQASANLAEELEAANQKSNKFEAAVRKLRQMLSETQAELADKEKAYEERLKTAENLRLAAEERARNAASLVSVIDFGGPALPPPPPPPMPTYKIHYEIKVNRTGQSSLIEGEPGKPKNARNFFVDSIVDAIKKGVSLRKTGLREYDEEGDLTSTFSESSPQMEEDDLNVEDAFAAMAREIAINKQKREREKVKEEQAVEVTKKKGGELDNLLAELADLDALIEQ